MSLLCRVIKVFYYSNCKTSYCGGILIFQILNFSKQKLFLSPQLNTEILLLISQTTGYLISSEFCFLSEVQISGFCCIFNCITSDISWLFRIYQLERLQEFPVCELNVNTTLILFFIEFTVFFWLAESVQWIFKISACDVI